ncbi:acetyl-CoA carboxylase biotin carboxyl carrier protein [Shewanella cyperi]|uniref:Biotin carboxyl carrier protein of acetyl-CoA carboxylase n=1 Tax=Shewanella cyperi TaxID=2814292 RepID=A0A974XJT5_9GAMM|nr:acetyl-CoA carboxylase biotin carboxyl carrier protein [Shewanella cyperi]QSX29710.1 acetyl-CoA carboxylase biotin carboxyl carrier protein [Shewanella cyperi]
MDIRKIKKLIEMVTEAGIQELEVKEGETSVRIVRQGNQATAAIPAAQQPAPKTPQPSDGRQRVLSPMVGTFYRGPSPEAKPFVELGTQVSRGDTLAVIEAMKMLNQIAADCDGVVNAILVDNGATVEFDQPLFILEPLRE